MRRRQLFPTLFNTDETPGGATAEGAPTPPDAGTGTEVTSPPAGYVPEDRYKEAQGWGTRLSQENATLKADAELARALRSNDPSVRQQALEALGFEFDDGNAGANDDQLFDQTDPRILAELEELKGWRDQTVSQQQSEANYSAYRQIADPQMQSLGVPEGLHDVIAEAALNLPPVHTPQGQAPDIEGAWKQFETAYAEHFAAIPAVQAQVKKAWASTKPTAPVTRPGGTDGTGVTAFKNGEERRAHMLARFSADQ